VRKGFLWQDYLWSLQEKTRLDCRDKCFGCGILPKFNDQRVRLAEKAWFCPPVERKAFGPRRITPP